MNIFMGKWVNVLFSLRVQFSILKKLKLKGKFVQECNLDAVSRTYHVSRIELFLMKNT